MTKISRAESNNMRKFELEAKAIDRVCELALAAFTVMRTKNVFETENFYNGIRKKYKLENASGMTINHDTLDIEPIE